MFLFSRVLKAGAFVSLTALASGCSFNDDDDAVDPVASITTSAAQQTASAVNYGSDLSVTVGSETYEFTGRSTPGTVLTSSAEGDDSVNLVARFGTNVNMLALTRSGGADASNDFVTVDFDAGSGVSSAIPVTGIAVYDTQLVRLGYDTSTREATSTVTTVVELQADFGIAGSVVCSADCGSWTFDADILASGAVTGLINDGSNDFTIENGGFYGTTGISDPDKGELAGSFKGNVGDIAYVGYFHGD